MILHEVERRDLTMLTLHDYVRLGARRREFDEWLTAEGLNGPLHITEIAMVGHRRANVVVAVAGKRLIHHLSIDVNLKSDPPADVLAWSEAA